MKFRFDPKDDLIVIPARILGPKGPAVADLALDTGASTSLISQDILVSLGYVPENAKTHVQVITGSGIEAAPEIAVRRLEALGRHRQNFPVLCRNLPQGATVDGLLGLDFFRKRRLKIDFKKGIVTLD